MYRKCGKRAFDVAIALPALFLLLPFLLLLAILVRVGLGSPILFRQRRPGLKGRPFEMFKFRTMTDGRGLDGMLLPDCDRTTRLGRFLRSSSLDELPELINVLTGEMSLVGPRPLLMEYVGLYTPGQMRAAQMAGHHGLGPGKRPQSIELAGKI